MTISSTTNTVSYNGNGSTTAFAVPYVFFGTGTTSEVQVVEVVIATGAETIKSNGSDFTVSGGSGATGTVTATVAPASTVKWVINRATTQTQETDYVENDPFPAESHEEALDRLTAIDQEQQRALDRTAQLPDGYTGSFDPTLPTNITGNAVLAFNAGATAFEIGPTAAAISGAAAEAAAAAASATAADASETAAAASETNAATSASNASTSETNAANSAAAAAASANGIFWKAPALVATTANITLSGEQTIDGVLTSASRVLVKDQTAPAENGVYVSAAGAWTRATPLDAWDEFPGAAINVSQGTTYGDTSWICTSDAGGTLGTTAITWSQFSQIVSAATESAAGIVELATSTEVATGSDTARAVTPAGLASVTPSIKAIAQNSQSADYTTVLADAGKHIYHPAADTTPRTWTIDSNANVAYPIGTAITFDNDYGAGAITIAITSDTLVLVGSAGSTGSRTLASGGRATAVKVTSTRWRISGVGLT
jgi:hypothetical protein